MATYYHGGAEIQSDELQTLCLMNPGCVGYPPPDDAGVGDSPTTSNMMFFNSGALGHHQHLMGIPLHQNQSVVSVQDMASYNLWNPSPMTNNSVGLTSHLGIRQKGLSLSLLPEQKQINYGINQQHHLRFSGSESEVEPANGISGMQRVLLGSKYLKAAQQLLDDVVSVGKGVVKKESQNTAAKSTKEMLECEESNAGETSGKRAAVELSMTERQELQTKKAKLINMFDEAEKRYRQYYNQMQVVISSFEVIAGVGTAKTYTALALKTISKQFRCLRDALSGQIRATSKNLGEEDCQIGSKSGEGLTRLRFVDHHLRQQRALQQLGTMQHNAWRPQRGLPERSVSVLRAWLFEHFLHPYPKDSDKHILAKQTGLTRNQVSNWFINARVRLWKPMVEEMYLEETKAKEADRKCGGEAEADVIPTSTVVYAEEEDGGEENEEKIHKKPRIRDSSSLLIDPMSTLEMELKPLDTATTSTNSNSHDALFMRFGETTDFGGGPYSIGDFARFGNDGHSQFTPAQQPHHHQQQQQQQHFSGNGVTLTLGLQHCDGLSLSGPPPATYLSSTNDSNHSNIPMGRRLQGLGNVTHDAREYNNSEYETLLSNQLLGQ